MIAFAKVLRRNLTDAELALWRQFRAKRFIGLEFSRHVPIGPYMTNFCSLRAKIVIEVDGGPHDEDRYKDEIRSRFLEQQGFTVLRFWDTDVLGNIEGVMFSIGRSTLR